MIKITADDSGVKKSYKQLKERLFGASRIGQVMKITADSIWIPKIKARLGVSTSTSGYEQELSETMHKLDQEFVARLAGQSLNSLATSAWADRTEAERRVPGGYKQGEITNAIERAIKSSQPFKIVDGIAIGIGAYSVLDSLFPQLDSEQTYKLWQILNYGTGTIGAGKGPVIRTGAQIFYNRKIRKGVLAYATSNPGFKGREFFVTMDNTMHESDFVVQQKIINYMKSVVRDLSYRKK